MSGGEYETILIEKGDGITWVIFNRPEKRNAMSPQLHYDMEAALDELALDPETRVLVITGAGGAFSAGMDLKLFFRDTAADPVARERSRHASLNWAWHLLAKFPKPTIAMVNGYCFGGAFTQVVACDFAIAAEDATFGLSEINWGILPGGLVSWNATQLLGFRDAMYYAMTGDSFDGLQAARIGFVTRAVPGASLRDETVALARTLMDKNPMALRFTREAIRAVRHMTVTEAQDYLRAKFDALKFSDKQDGSEAGMKQFLDDKSYRPGFEPYRRESGSGQGSL